MQSQSQIEEQYRESRARSIIRHMEQQDERYHRRLIRLVMTPFILLGSVGVVWYVTLPYPAEEWPFGIASVVVLALSLCIATR